MNRPRAFQFLRGGDDDVRLSAWECPCLGWRYSSERVDDEGLFPAAAPASSIPSAGGRLDDLLGNW
jgi:hypothetical protein